MSGKIVKNFLNKRYFFWNHLVDSSDFSIFEPELRWEFKKVKKHAFDQEKIKILKKKRKKTSF